MTRYEQGFMSKCAEYNIPAGAAASLMKKTAVDMRTATRVAQRLKTSKNPIGLVERLMGKLQMATGGTEFGFLDPALQKKVLPRLRNINPGMRQYLSGMDTFMRDSAISQNPRAKEYTQLLADMLEGGPLRHADAILGAGGDVGKAMERVSKGAPAKFGKREVEIAKNLRDALARGKLAEKGIVMPG